MIKESLNAMTTSDEMYQKLSSFRKIKPISTRVLEEDKKSSRIIDDINHIDDGSIVQNQNSAIGREVTCIEYNHSEKNREASTQLLDEQVNKRRKVERDFIEVPHTFKLDLNEKVDEDTDVISAKSMENVMKSAVEEVVQEEQEHEKNIREILNEYGINQEGMSNKSYSEVDGIIDEDTNDDDDPWLQSEQSNLNSNKITPENQSCDLMFKLQRDNPKEIKRNNFSRWKDNFQRLERYFQKYGHCRVSQSQTDRQFYSWISRQRHLYKLLQKNGKANSLTPEKIDQLNQIGFVWNVYDSKEKKKNMYADVSAVAESIPANNDTARCGELQNFDNTQVNDNSNQTQIITDGESVDNAKSKSISHSTVKSWDEYYEELKTYKLLHGDIQVISDSDEYRDLASWVENQQEAHKQLNTFLSKKNKDINPSIKLNLTQIVKLNCLGFVWVKDKIKGVWEKKFEELRIYRNRFGNCNVPEKYDENPSLGKWVSYQRQQYARKVNGKKSNMSSLRVKLLRSLGFEWDIMKKDVWNERYQELVAYKNMNGDCKVPRNYSLSPKLSLWVRTQRAQYCQLFEKERPSNMTTERIDKLNEIGFEWELNAKRGPNVKWEERMKELEQFIIENGHGNVSHRKNAKLANWITSQRKQYNLYCSGKPSSISIERIEALNKIGFEWVLRERQKREDRIRELKEYKEEFGNCMVPKRWSRNKRLGQWVAEQRKQYKYLITGKPSHMTPEVSLCIIG